MKPKAKFQVGSRRFFTGLDGFTPKDNDELCIMEGFGLRDTSVIHGSLRGKDIFFYRDMDKDQFINYTVECSVPMRVGMFLVPEFCEYLGFTIEDYERLENLFNILDEKHKYEILIRDFYIENGGFFLTDQQRLIVYKEYLDERRAR